MVAAFAPEGERKAVVDLSLAGRLVLVVEDEPIIAVDIVHWLRAAGARVSHARTLRDALRKVEEPELSAAVIDHGLSDGDASQICSRLDQRCVPFVVYSGYNHVKGPCSEGTQVSKPVPPIALVEAVTEALLQQGAGRDTPRL